MATAQKSGAALKAAVAPFLGAMFDLGSTILGLFQTIFNLFFGGQVIQGLQGTRVEATKVEATFQTIVGVINTVAKVIAVPINLLNRFLKGITKVGAPAVQIFKDIWGILSTKLSVVLIPVRVILRGIFDLIQAAKVIVYEFFDGFVQGLGGLSLRCGAL